MKRNGTAAWARNVFVLVMALMLCTGVFAVSAAANDPLKPEDVHSTDGNITLHKQAERIGPEAWEVTVSADVKNIEVEPPKLEVVFVLDTSNSMLGCTDEALHAMPNGFHYHDDTCLIGDECIATFINHRGNNYCYIWNKSYQEVKYEPNRYFSDTLSQIIQRGTDGVEG